MSTELVPARELISIEKFAQLCGVSSRTVRNWIHHGQLPAYRLTPGRGLLRVDRRDLEFIVKRARPEEVSP